MLLSQYNMTQIIALLRQNPGLAVFPFYTSDAPNGVTRAQLVAAFNALAFNAGNFDANGNWNFQKIELGGAVYGSQVVGGKQVSQKYQPNENGNSNAASLPAVLPGQFNTGNFVNNPGEFSPAGTVADVPPNTPTVGTPGATPTASATVGSGAAPSALVSPGTAFGSSGYMLNTPSQVQ